MPLDPGSYEMVCEKPLNDLLSECQSFGSNCRLSSQPRKISIGILADSGAQFRPKKDAAVVAEECKTQPQLEEDGKKLQEGNNGKQSQVLEQKMSLLSTRAFDRKISTSEAHDMSDGATKAKITFSAHYTNLKPGVEGNARLLGQPGKVVSGSKDVNAEVRNKLSFAPGQSIMPDNNADKTEIKGSETLRASLWKILETVSSPQKQHPSARNLKNKEKESDCVSKNTEEVSPVLKSIRRSDRHLSDGNLKNKDKETDFVSKNKEEVSPVLKSIRRSDKHLSDGNLKNKDKESDCVSINKKEVSPVLKSMQRSDTIESDSDCPNHGLRRSLGLKKASNKVERKRTTEPSLYNEKHKRLKKAYPRSEVFTAGLSVQNTGDSPILQQKGGRQGSASEKCEMLFNEQENKQENVQANSREQSCINNREDTNGFSFWKNNKFVKPTKLGVEKDYVRCPLGNTFEHPSRADDSPKVQEYVDCPNGLGHSSNNNTIAEESDFESPTFKLQTLSKSPICSQPCEMKTPNKGLSNGSPFKHVSSLGCGGLDDHGHQDKSGIKGIKSFKSFLASRQNDYLADSQMNISKHDAENLQGTVGKFRKPVVVEESAKGIHDLMIEHSDSEASEEERISEASSEEDLNTQGCVESESLSPEDSLPAKGAFVLDLENKEFYQGGFRVSGFCTNLASEKGTKRHFGSADQQDELSRAVALFSSALEGVKSKMKSVARKRSAEILMSVADRIHLQLQNAESHIQADVQKLGSYSKSKKKRLEMRCEELQEELNVMHRNFKEEVNKHLQKCKSTVEGLDTQELELKATVEKQRASHRKLFLEAEKAIEADLIDGQKRISVIQNLASKKMLELKKLVADLLKEGIIT